MDRNTIKSGPAILMWNGAVIHFKGGLTMDEVTTTFDVETDVYATPDKRRDQVTVELSGTPSGQWKDLGVLYPWLAAKVGARLHGATDKAAVAWWLDGDKYTYHNAGIATMPPITFSPVKTLLGAMKMEARHRNNTARSAANSLYTRANEAFDDDTFDWIDVPTQTYVFNLGESPWDDFDTDDGVTMTPTVSWNDLGTDALGILDREVTGLEIVSSFTPVGIAQSAIDAKMMLQGDAAAMRGARLAAVGADFIITGSGVYVAQRNASLQKSQIRAGKSVKRSGQVEAVSSLGFVDGAAIAQMFVGTEAPA